jgi:uncharacterized protein YjiS (DUF1127 family)
MLRCTITARRRAFGTPPATAILPGLDTMNAHVSKEELALLLPSSLSTYFKDAVPYMPQPEAQGPSLVARLAGALRWLAALPGRRAVMNELGALTDHELADIGLSRSELSRVFDADFASSRSAERYSRINATGYVAFG